MSTDIKASGALVFPEGVPTRAGEVVNSVGEIYDIPAPRVGMIVYDKSSGINYIVRSLKAKVIDGIRVDNAQVDKYELYDVAAETKRAEREELKNATAITFEAERAETAEQVLDDKITAEKQRASAAEQVNTNAIAAEATRAQNAEQALNSRVDAIKPIVITDSTITNAPDEEDLTMSGNLLKLKNRQYGDGLGYVILRKNKSFVSQLEENTIIEIRYRYDLNSTEVELPNNCILKFNGGSLCNGTIKANASSAVSADMYQIFSNITFNGVLGASNALPEWFGAVGDGVTDDTEAIQRCLDVFGFVYLSAKKYKVTRTIILPYKGKVCGDGILLSEATSDANNQFAVVDLAFGSTVTGIIIEEAESYNAIRLDVTQLNRTWKSYIDGKEWEDIIPKITLNNIKISAKNTMIMKGDNKGNPLNRNGSKAISITADGSYIDGASTKGFSYLYAHNIAILGGYEYGVHLDVTDRGNRPEGAKKTDYVTDCVFKAINCNGYVRKGFYIGGGVSYAEHGVPTRIIIDGCTTQYMTGANSGSTLEEWQAKTFFDYFVKIDTGDSIQIINCRPWDVPPTYTYVETDETGESKEVTAENKIYRINPNTTINIVIKDTFPAYSSKIHYEDANGDEIVDEVSRPVIVNTLRSQIATSSFEMLNVVIPLREVEVEVEGKVEVKVDVMVAKDLLSLPSGIYRVDSSYNYGLFMGLPQPEMNMKGGFCYIDHFEGASILKFIPNTYIASTTSDGIHANTITCCYAALSRKDVDSKVDWIAMQPKLSTYASLIDFKKIRTNNTLGLINGKYINNHYVSGEPLDAMGFTWTENAPDALPTGLAKRDIGKMVFYEGRPVWWNGEGWVNANGEAI